MEQRKWDYRNQWVDGESGIIDHADEPTSWPSSLINDLRLHPVNPYFGLVARGGWHLSYFKSLTRIMSKLDAFAHQEANTVEIRDRARSRIREGRSFVYDDPEFYCRFGIEWDPPHVQFPGRSGPLYSFVSILLVLAHKSSLRILVRANKQMNYKRLHVTDGPCHLFVQISGLVRERFRGV